MVLCTQDFQSILLEEAKSEEEKNNVSLSDLADEVFKKNGKNIRKSFDAVLRNEYGIQPENFYVLCDRAGENVKGFGDRYLCCFGHQTHNAFK